MRPFRLPTGISMVVSTLAWSCAAPVVLGDEPSLPTTETARVSQSGSELNFHRLLTSEFEKVDPAADNWESESFSEEASAQLKKIAKLLLKEKEIGIERLGGLIAEEIACAPLLPKERERLFSDQTITIRQSPESKHTPTTMTKGAPGFARALQELAGTLAGMTDRRAKFKISHVALEAGRATTNVLFELRGRSEAGWRQITSTWRITWTRDSPPRIREIQVASFREATPGTKGRIEFADVAPVVLAGNEGYAPQMTKGFDYWRARSDKGLVADLLGAQGVIVGDVNGDQLDDVYVLQPGGLPNRLFVHGNDHRASDTSRAAGVDILDFCRSALFIDLDNDGDQDLVLALAWNLAIFANDGTGRFELRGQYPSEGQINSISAADYDLDGDLDIYICGRDASGAIKAEQGVLGIPMPYYDANNGGPNTLWRNDGELSFSDVTRETGLDVNNRRFSLACAWEDFDNDGDQDLYVANDFGRNNLYRNDGPDDSGRHRFVDVAPALGVEDVGPGMSAAWGDINNDGLMDLYVANMWSNAGNRITPQKNFLPGGSEETKRQALRHARGNSLYLNSGPTTAGHAPFVDHTKTSGTNMARWAWSSNFLDMNNDGLEDIVVANGMITTEDTGDL